MKKVSEISIEEIVEIFSKCSSNSEVLKYYGYKNNGSGQRFIKALREKAGIDFHDYFNHLTDREHYEKNPKICAACGCILPYEKRYNKFCSSSCAAVYNNTKRGYRSFETRVKISESLKGNTLTDEEIKQKANDLKNRPHQKCLNCGKEIVKGTFCSIQCANEYKDKDRVSKWLKGENPTRGATQIPSFIKRYLMNIYGCKCEKCGWGETNPATGKIPLEVHHIDGDCTNNKEENLQLLCPTHHAMTENFGSRNKNATRKDNRMRY